MIWDVLHQVLKSFLCHLIVTLPSISDVCFGLHYKGVILHIFLWWFVLEQMAPSVNFSCKLFLFLGTRNRNLGTSEKRVAPWGSGVFWRLWVCWIYTSWWWGWRWWFWLWVWRVDHRKRGRYDKLSNNYWDAC